ncbi:trafficking protein particle complex subunit 3-like protein [Tanacetum coccineum]|uniref:Trafficking protein particle complex subunit 3-like protein n=1 Tax=Tanacetum coccineum TaxID=301880 RepID=A0ABQ4Y0J8_9ASTR
MSAKGMCRIVRQLLTDLEEVEEVNKGYNIGIRLIDEFLAKSNVTRCVDLRETAEIIAKDVPLAMIQKYLRMKADFVTKFCIKALKVYETSAMNQEILEGKRAQLDNQNYEENNSSFSSRQFQSKSGDFKQEFGELKKYRAFVFNFEVWLLWDTLIIKITDFISSNYDSRPTALSVSKNFLAP